MKFIHCASPTMINSLENLNLQREVYKIIDSKRAYRTIDKDLKVKSIKLVLEGTNQWTK